MNQAEDLFFLFSSVLNISEKKGHLQPPRSFFFFFFALHRPSVMKTGCLQTCRPNFALPISATLSFKIFSYAALCMNSIAHPGVYNFNNFEFIVTKKILHKSGLFFLRHPIHRKQRLYKNFRPSTICLFQEKINAYDTYHI